jgi:4-amino-4-deoxy-L-arabinose transferase-like glycosyltransferase
MTPVTGSEKTSLFTHISARPQLFYAVLFLLFAVLVSGVLLAKQPGCDEAWFFSPIYNFLTTGGTGTSILDAAGMPWSGIEKRTYWQVPVFYVAEAFWMKVFGLNLWAMRSLAALAGIGTLALWILLFQALRFERSVVMLSAAILATDYALMNDSANARMDTLSAFFGAAALLSYLRWRETNFTKCIFVSQCCLALCGLSHPMGGMVYLAAFAVLFVLNRDWKQLTVARVALAAVPYLVGGGAWGLYIAQDPQAFLRQFGSNTSGRLNGFLTPWQSVWREFVDRYLGTYGLKSSIGLAKAKLIIPVIYIAGALLAAFNKTLRHREPVHKVLLMLGASALVMMFADNFKYGLYLIHVVPMYAVLLASWVVWAWNARPALKPVLMYGMAGFMALQLMGAVYWIKRDAYHKEYLPLIQYVRSVTPPNGKVTGPAELGFELGFDTNLKDDYSLGYFTGRVPDVIVQDDLYRGRLKEVEDTPELHKSLLAIMARYHLTFSEPVYVVFTPVAPPAAASSPR